MNKKEKTANEVLAQNPQIHEVFVCDNENVFTSESRALEYCRQHDVQYLGSVTRNHMRIAMVNHAVDTYNGIEQALAQAKTVLAEKEHELQQACNRFSRALNEGTELDTIANEAAQAVKKAEAQYKEADSKAKNTNTEADKKAASEAKEFLKKVHSDKTEADKAALNQNSIEINKAEAEVNDAKKELEAAIFNVDKLTTNLANAKTAIEAVK